MDDASTEVLQLGGSSCRVPRVEINSSSFSESTKAKSKCEESNGDQVSVVQDLLH